VIVLLVLFGSLSFFRALGMAGVAAFQSWILSARVALAVMFLFTATSHFTPMKKDLIAMVSPGLPRPDLLVLLTGIAELAGAIGLPIPATRYWAAWGLMVLMAAMLPVNISAAKRGVLLRGQPATRLWVRIPMKVLFIGWAWLIK
jgi:uncharacterized membrane protein